MKRICRGTPTMAVFVVLTVLLTAYSIHHYAGEAATPTRLTGQAGECRMQLPSTADDRPGVPTMAPPLGSTAGGVSQLQHKHPTQMVYVNVEADRPDIEVQLRD